MQAAGQQAAAVGEKDLQASVQAVMRRAADPEEECVAWSRACYKNRDHQGTLLLSNKRLLWTRLGAEKPHVDLALCGVQNFHFNADQKGDAKLLVATGQQQLAQGEGYLFIFDHAKDRDGFRQLLGKVRDTNAVLPPMVRKRKRQEEEEGKQGKAAKRARYGALLDKAGVQVSKQRATLMAQDPNLRKLHGELVPKVLSEEEFWRGRGDELRLKQLAADVQATGMSNAMLNDVEPVSKAYSRPRYRITPQVIHQIFIEQPSVRVVYERNVPHKMTEKEFWTRYFKSRYFHRNRMRDHADVLSYASDALFSECRDVDEELTPNYGKLAGVNPLLNLTVEEEVRHGYGADKPADDISMKARPLIQRFNRHADLVLSNPAATSSSARRREQSAPKARNLHDVIAEATVLPDLEKERDTPTIPLDIPNQRVYFEEEEDVVMADGPAHLPGGVLAWTPGADLSAEPLCGRVAGDVLQECTKVMKREEAERKSAHERILSDDQLQLELNEQFLKAHELLRHFWRAYPITSEELLRKVHKLKAALSQLFDAVQAKRDSLVAEAAQLAAADREPLAHSAKLLTPLLRSLRQAIVVAEHSKPRSS